MPKEALCSCLICGARQSRLASQTPSTDCTIAVQVPQNQAFCTMSRRILRKPPLNAETTGRRSKDRRSDPLSQGVQLLYSSEAETP